MLSQKRITASTRYTSDPPGPLQFQTYMHTTTNQEKKVLTAIVKQLLMLTFPTAGNNKCSARVMVYRVYRITGCVVMVVPASGGGGGGYLLSRSVNRGVNT